MQHNVPIRSGESRIPSYILLENHTQRQVDAYWIDFQGNPVLFAGKRPIMPAGKLAVNTFSTHPWMFKDHNTGERMHVDHQPILWPHPWYLYTLPKDLRIQRQPVQIHLPMRSLKRIAMLVVCDALSSEKSIEELELPQSLHRDLTEIYHNRSE